MPLLLDTRVGATPTSIVQIKFSYLEASSTATAQATVAPTIGLLPRFSRKLLNSMFVVLT